MQAMLHPNKDSHPHKYEFLKIFSVPCNAYDQLTSTVALKITTNDFSKHT